MMKIDSAHKSSWEIAEVIFGVPFLLSIAAIQFAIPFSITTQGLLGQVLVPVGIALILFSVGLIALARREFARFRQPTDPGHPTSKLVTTGVFSISRNPLYLGGSILFFGIALTVNLLLVLVALLLSIIICHYVLIIPEEKYLAAKFGDEYEEYSSTVRRWFGRK